MNRNSPLKGSSVIPKINKRKQACKNIHNRDKNCFKWALNPALHYPRNYKVENANRPSTFEVADIAAPIIELKRGKQLDFTDL